MPSRESGRPSSCPKHGQHISKYKGAHSVTARTKLPAAASCQQLSTITTDSATANQATPHNRPYFPWELQLLQLDRTSA